MDDETKDANDDVTIDEMVKYVGEFKLFQWLVGSMFCIMMIPSTFQVLIMYFPALNPDWKCVDNSTVCRFNGTLPPKNNSRCDIERSSWEFSEKDDYSIVTYFDLSCKREWLVEFSQSIVFLGSIVGSIVLGWGADNFGRKKIIFISMAAIIVFGFINAFISSLVLFLAFRFFIGIFIPGTNIQMTVLLSEMTGERFRPISGTLCWTFFPVALCIMSLKAYLIRTWKTFIIVCTIPYIFVLAFYFFVPESLRWLRLHGKTKELMQLFERIARWNSLTIPPHLTIKMSDANLIHRKSNPLDLFRSRKVLLVTIIQGFSLFMHGMVYYGFSMAAGELGDNIYVSFFLLSLIEVPAGVLSIFLCHIGRKKSTITAVIISGTSCVILSVIPVRYGMARIMCAMVGKFSITCSFNTVALWEIELYPTTIRSQGMGFLNILCRIGAATAPWIVKRLDIWHESAQFIFMGVTALTSSGLQFMLPETKGLPTLEVVKRSDDCLILDDVSNPTIVSYDD